MSHRPYRRVLAVVSLAIAAIGLVPVTAGASGDHRHPPHRPRPPRTVDVQLLGINDFHGHIQASTPGCITVPGSTADRRGVPQPGRPGPRRRRRLPEHAPRPAPGGQPARHRPGRIGRPDRRQPAGVGDLPRRTGDRGAQRHGPAAVRARQPRVGRGPRRADAHARRRLPPGRRLLPDARRRAVLRRRLPLRRLEHLLQGHAPAGAPAVRDQAGQGPADRLHRRRPRGDADDRAAVRRRRRRLRRRVDRDQQVVEAARPIRCEVPGRRVPPGLVPGRSDGLDQRVQGRPRPRSVRRRGHGHVLGDRRGHVRPLPPGLHLRSGRQEGHQRLVVRSTHLRRRPADRSADPPGHVGLGSQRAGDPGRPGRSRRPADRGLLHGTVRTDRQPGGRVHHR